MPMDDLEDVVDDLAQEHLRDPDGSPKEKVRRLGRKVSRLTRKARAQEQMMASVADSLKDSASTRGADPIEAQAQKIRDL